MPQIFCLFYHISPSFTAFHYQLVHDKILKLNIVNVIRALAVPLLIRGSDHFLKDGIEFILSLALNNVVDVVELVLD